MLFDLRSGARRRTVKIVYLGLALLMFVGFVGFSIGSSGLSGSIGDAITGNGTSSGGGNDTVVERLTTQVRPARRRRPRPPRATPPGGPPSPRPASASPTSATTSTPPPATTPPPASRQLTAAGTAWDKYLALNPPKPDERLARQMAQAYLSLGNPDKAVTAQEVVTEVDPTQQTFPNLAILAYQAGQTRKGDLAAAKAVELAPKDDQKDLKAQLDPAKTQALTQQIQQAAPTRHADHRRLTLPPLSCAARPCSSIGRAADS